MAECGLCKNQKLKKDLFLDNEKSSDHLFYCCKEPCTGGVCLYCGKKDLPMHKRQPWTFCGECYPKLVADITPLPQWCVDENGSSSFTFDDLDIRENSFFLRDFEFQRDASGKFVYFERVPDLEDEGVAAGEIDPGFFVSEERLKEYGLRTQTPPPPAPAPPSQGDFEAPDEGGKKGIIPYHAIKRELYINSPI